MHTVTLAFLQNLGAAEVVILLGGMGVAAVFVLLPSLIAFETRHPHRYLLLAANGLLSWSIVGWIAVLIWALYGTRHHDFSGYTNDDERRA